MIYDSDYVKMKIHNGVLDWSNGLTIVELSSIRRMQFHSKEPAIVLYTTNGTHFLFPAGYPNTSDSREQKKFYKDMGNAYVWLTKMWHATKLK